MHSPHFGSGILAGLLTGLGAATADALYGCIAGFGLTAISDFLVRQEFWLGLIGGGFLCYLGFRTAAAKPSQETTAPSRIGLLPAYGSTLALTLTNPLTILSFAAVFAGFGLGSRLSPGYASACKVVAGVFTGSALWWMMLSGSVGLVRVKIRPELLCWVNRVSGCMLLGFGLYALAKSFLPGRQ